MPLIPFYNRILSLVCCLSISLTLVNRANAQCTNQDFTANVRSGCAPLIVDFEALNFAPGSTFLWDFGNGKVSGNDKITQIFTASGYYTISVDINTGGNVCTVSKTQYIEVFATPTPQISVFPGKVVCNGVNRDITLTDNTPNATSWSWIIDGQSYNSRSVTVKFTSKGNKAVSLEAKVGSGCPAFLSDKNFLQLSDSIPVEFCGVVNVGATSVTAAFTPRVSLPTGSTRSIVSYNWSFPGGTPSSHSGQTPPSVTYSKTAVQDVTLQVTLSDGCVYTCKRVNYIRPPVSIPRDSVCAGNNFYVTNRLNGDGKKNFGYTLFDAEIDPMTIGPAGLTTKYNKAGSFNYEVSFGYDLSACRHTYKVANYVYVRGPKAAFFLPVKNTCNPKDSFILKNQSLAQGAQNLRYTWTITDSNKNVVLVIGPTTQYDAEVRLNQYGRFDVKLLASSSNGCADSMTIENGIFVSEFKAGMAIPEPVVCVGKSFQALGDPTPKEAPGINYKYTWTFQHMDSAEIKEVMIGKMPSFTPTVPGRYKIILAMENGPKCKDTARLDNAFTVNGVSTTFDIREPSGCPEPSHMSTLVLNKSKILKFPKTGNGNLRYQWEIAPEDDVFIVDKYADSTPVFFGSSGTYDISISIFDEVDCQSQIVKRNGVKIGSGANFAIPEIKCIGDTADLIVGVPPTTSWFKWEYEPKNAIVFLPHDSAPNPKIVITRDTCVSITLKSYAQVNGRPCSSEVVRTKCLQAFRSGFTSDDTLKNCAPATVTLVADDFSADAYVWDFGDGESLISKLPIATHLYPQNSNAGYTVTLLAIDSSTCSDAVTRENYIKVRGPVPYFTMDKIRACEGEPVLFRDSSENFKERLFTYGNGVTIDSAVNGYYRYTFDDDTKDSLLFTPTLVATDSTCSQFLARQITILRSPRAGYEADKTIGCAPVTVQFVERSKYAVSHWWDFNGDGIGDATDANPSFTYDTAGQFTVTHVVVNALGCPDTVRIPNYITLFVSPTSTFVQNTRTLCDSGLVTFAPAPTNHSSYTFNYGDGSPSTTDTIPPHSYQVRDFASGKSTYYTRLTTSSLGGCKVTDIDSVTVYATPKVDFQADTIDGCDPLTVRFQNLSIYASKFYWYYDDSGVISDSSANPTHVFSPGKHTIRLVAVNEGGCQSELTKTDYITVNPIPVADFTTADTLICLYESAQFTDLSTPAANIRFWLWTMDDVNAPGNDIALTQNPSFQFFTSGRRNITLTVTDDQGCSNTVTKSILTVEDTLAPPNSRIEYISVDLSNQVEGFYTPTTLYDFNYLKAYRDGNEIFTSTNPAQTYFQDPTSAPDKALVTYQLQTTDDCLNLSSLSAPHATVFLQGVASTNGVVSLNWTPYLGQTTLQHVVYRSDGGIRFVAIDTLPASTFSYTDSLVCQPNYAYRVAALLQSPLYAISYSNYINLTTYPVTPPVTNIKRVSVSSQNTIRIELESVPGYAPRKTILDRLDEQTGWNLNYAIFQGSSVEDNQVLSDQKSYTYRVRTIDECNQLSLPGNIGKSILLQTPIINQYISPTWTSYTYWPEGVKFYIVQAADAQGLFKDVYILANGDTTWADPNLYEQRDSAFCYRVLAIRSGGIPDTSYSNISCSILPSRIFIPSAFSPSNNDELNDTWQPQPLQIINLVDASKYNLSIYDRWGNLVFTSNDPYEAWNGRKTDGTIYPEGVYLYSIKAQGLDTKSLNLRGSLHLIR